MVVLRMMGGLGNQMFIYAFYEKLLSMGKNVKVDLTFYDQTDAHNGYELEEVFGISLKESSQKENEKFANFDPGMFPYIIRHTIKRRTLVSYEGERALQYYPKVFSLDDNYLCGYWQSEKYFDSIKKVIREKFSFDDNNRKDKAFMDVLNEIRAEANPVSIHVRRGDYVGKRKSHGAKGVILKIRDLLVPTIKHGDVCTPTYYKNAMCLLDSKDLSPTYYIFSDDIQWCRDNFSFIQSKCVFVDINKGKDSYWDMYLMSQCKHNIIANSSFSWWGAWLNQHCEKIVLAPDRWFTSGFLGDILPEDWIKIPTM